MVPHIHERRILEPYNNNDKNTFEAGHTHTKNSSKQTNWARFWVPESIQKRQLSWNWTLLPPHPRRLSHSISSPVIRSTDSENTTISKSTNRFSFDIVCVVCVSPIYAGDQANTKPQHKQIYCARAKSVSEIFYPPIEPSGGLRAYCVCTVHIDFQLHAT